MIKWTAKSVYRMIKWTAKSVYRMIKWTAKSVYRMINKIIFSAQEILYYWVKCKEIKKEKTEMLV